MLFSHRVTLVVVIQAGQNPNPYHNLPISHTPAKCTELRVDNATACDSFSLIFTHFYSSIYQHTCMHSIGIVTRSLCIQLW